MAAWTDYTADLPVPEQLQRAADNPIRCPVERSGSLVAPSSGTVSVYDQDNAVVVDAAAVVVAASVAEYTVTAATLPDTLTLGDRWRVEWKLVMPDGNTHTFRNDGALVRHRYYGVITEGRLDRRHQGLADLLASGQSLQQFIDEARLEIQQRLLSTGRRPWLVLNPHALGRLEMALSLQYVFRDAASSVGGAGRYAELSRDYEAQAERLWRELRVTLDHNRDGHAQVSETGQSGQPVIFLSAGPGYRRRHPFGV